MRDKLEFSDQRSVIDLAPAMVRVGDDRKLLSDLAGFYVEDSEQLITEMQRGVKAGDAELVMRTAHSLKGLSANFDAHSTMEVAREIEQAGREAALEKAAKLIPELKRRVALVVLALQEEFFNKN